jgi:hypothetical protein
MHLGEKEKTPAKVEYWMSYPLMIDCPTCGRTYDYSDSKEKFWQKELPPPPTGYSNRLAAPPVQNKINCRRKLKSSSVVPWRLPRKSTMIAGRS